jgi:hypothetical protein
MVQSDDLMEMKVQKHARNHIMFQFFFFLVLFGMGTPWRSNNGMLTNKNGEVSIAMIPCIFGMELTKRIQTENCTITERQRHQNVNGKLKWED